MPRPRTWKLSSERKNVTFFGIPGTAGPGIGHASPVRPGRGSSGWTWGGFGIQGCRTLDGLGGPWSGRDPRSHRLQGLADCALLQLILETSTCHMGSCLNLGPFWGPFYKGAYYIGDLNPHDEAAAYPLPGRGRQLSQSFPRGRRRI